MERARPQSLRNHVCSCKELIFLPLLNYKKRTTTIDFQTLSVGTSKIAACFNVFGSIEPVPSSNIILIRQKKPINDIIKKKKIKEN